MKICPLCNGLEKMTTYCPNCGEVMQDTGPVTYYYEPYSPYLDSDILEQADGVSPACCLHLFSCLQCGYDRRCPVIKT